MKDFKELSYEAKIAAQALGYAKLTNCNSLQVDINDCVVAYDADELREFAVGLNQIADWLDKRKQESEKENA